MNSIHNNYTGVVTNGVIVLENGTVLPEGVVVNVELVSEPIVRLAEPDESKAASPLGELLLKFAGVAKDLPADMAKNHDHYLYGAPKVSDIKVSE